MPLRDLASNGREGTAAALSKKCAQRFRARRPKAVERNRTARGLLAFPRHRPLLGHVGGGNSNWGNVSIERIDLVLSGALRAVRASGAGQSARPFLRKPPPRLCQRRSRTRPHASAPAGGVRRARSQSRHCDPENIRGRERPSRRGRGVKLARLSQGARNILASTEYFSRYRGRPFSAAWMMR
jgi:hypothetical protein